MGESVRVPFRIYLLELRETASNAELLFRLGLVSILLLPL